MHVAYIQDLCLSKSNKIFLGFIPYLLHYLTILRVKINEIKHKTKSGEGNPWETPSVTSLSRLQVPGDLGMAI